jgi:hypothetical protein
MTRGCLIPLVLTVVLGTLPSVRAEDQTPPGFEPLFNGKDLSGWKVVNGKAEVWGVDKGLLVVDGRGGGWLMTEKEYADFELRLEYKLPEKGNSGVALRAPLNGKPSAVAMEIQILDDAWHKANLKGLKPTQLTGSIYDVVPPSAEVTRPVGQWNQLHITAKGRRITVKLNGTTIVDANLDNYKDRLDKHPGLLRTTGHLGLQSHDGRVEFRSLYVKSL